METIIYINAYAAVGILVVWFVLGVLALFAWHFGKLVWRRDTRTPQPTRAQVGAMPRPVTAAEHEVLMAAAQGDALDAALPMQPICIASDGVVRFKRNRMVDDMYEFSKSRGFGLNEMVRRDYTQEERMQFAQLIGYSVSGYGSLSYASPESVEKADAIAASLVAARKQGANHD